MKKIIKILKYENYRMYFFYIAFLFILIFATTAPHIIHENGLIDGRYARWLVILFDLIIGYIIFSLYTKKLKQTKEEKELFANRLSQSYKYIGKAHGEVEILEMFFNYLKKHNEGSLNKKATFLEILSFLLSSVAQTDRGVLRFVDASSSRTETEFIVSKNSSTFDIKLSNNRIINEKEFVFHHNNSLIVKSAFNFGNLKCALAFPRHDRKINLKLLNTLIDQTHLFFVSLKTDK